jgi:homoserine kinase type II
VGVFTRLGDGEIAEIAAAFDLGPLAAFEPIAAGTINSNFDVRTESGRYFVRVNEGKAEVDVAWEARLVGALARGGLATPPPVPARDGRPYAPLARAKGKWVSVFPWRSGYHLGPRDVTEKSATTLGASLAQLHVIGEGLPTAWRRGSIYDHDHLVGRYERFADDFDPDLGHAVEVIGEELAIATDAMPLRRRASAGIIHGDLFRDNVLWDAGGAVAAILDFEQASGGSLAYDLAVAINDWCWNDGAADIGLAVALISGYRSVRPLTSHDLAALPIEIRVAATRFTITRITDVYLARVDNPEKDFRAFLARVEAWRGPSLGELTSAL